MSGQADTAPSLDDVAQLLFDNEGADAALEEREAPRGGESEEDNSDPALEELSDDLSEEAADPDATDPDDAEGDDEEGEDAPSQTSGELHEVRVVGADGAEVTEKVTLDELKDGYMRHADYTRKAMGLGERERQALEVVERQRNTYLHEAEVMHRAVNMLAEFKSDAEMAQLAQTNPSEWVAENARVQAIKGVLGQIEEGMRANAKPVETMTPEAQRDIAAKAWSELTKDGIDQPQLIEILKGVHGAYGVPTERLSKVTDPALVRIMRDAMKFRALDAKAKTLKPVVAKAPPLPAKRQPVPQQTRANQRLEGRFKSGRASTKDLGAWLQANGG